MTTAPTITTERLHLRPHRMEDFDPLYAVFASDRARYMGGPFSAKEMWYWIASEVGSWSLQGFGSWALERRADGAFLGQVGINKPQHFPEPEIGWVCLETAEGKGYAREGAEAALRWWWADHDRPSLVSYIHAENRRSIALAKRLGAAHDPSADFAEGDTKDDTVVYRHPRPAESVLQ